MKELLGKFSCWPPEEYPPEIREKDYLTAIWEEITKLCKSINEREKMKEEERKTEEKRSWKRIEKGESRLLKSPALEIYAVVPWRAKKRFLSPPALPLVDFYERRCYAIMGDTTHPNLWKKILTKLINFRYNWVLGLPFQEIYYWCSEKFYIRIFFKFRDLPALTSCQSFWDHISFDSVQWIVKLLILLL